MIEERLNSLVIDSPCKVDWSTMTGDEKIRFCHQCKFNVHNLSEMDEAEIESLFDLNTGRLCVRLYKRQDGTVLTRDCRTKMRVLKKAFRRSVASILGMAAWFGIAAPVNAQSAAVPQTITKESDRSPIHSNIPVDVNRIDHPKSGLQGVNTSRACGQSPQKDPMAYLVLGLMLLVFCSAIGGTIFLIKKGSSYLAIGSTLVGTTFLLGFLWTIYTNFNKPKVEFLMGEVVLPQVPQPPNQ